MLFTVAALLLTTLAWTGCEEPGYRAALPTTKMQLGKLTFTLEVADDENERRVGLMRRSEIPFDHGMIFVFEDERLRRFWMKDTYIPLDIIYLDSEGKVVSIDQLDPHDENGRSSLFPAQYAIELNQGAAGAAGVKVGDVLELPEDVLSPAD